MAQIKTELLQRLSAPHLRPLKKPDLLQLYSKLHEEYSKFLAAENPDQEDESAAKVDLNSIEAMKAYVDVAAQLLSEAQKARDEANRRPQVTSKRIIRNEQGQIASVIQEETS